MDKKYKYFILIFILIIIYLYYTINIKVKETFSNKNDAYVINLDSRPDRIEKIINNFSKYLNIYRVSAIRDKNSAKGCASSHISVIKMAKENKLPSVLVLEDDCVPTKDFDKWPKIKEWLDSNKDKWDLYVGGNSHYSWGDKSTIKPLCKLDSIKLYKTKTQTSHFFYWNSRAYDTYLEMEKTLDNEIADLYANKRNLIIITSVPFIAVQAKDYSDIEKKDVDYTDYFEKTKKIISSVENNEICL